MKSPSSLLPPLFFRAGLAAALLHVAAVATEAAPAGFPDGTIPSNVGMQLKGDISPETLDRVRDLGVKWVRRGFHWAALEKEKGVYDFSKFDAFVKDCKARQLGIIGCMALQNPLYGHVKDEPARSAYAAYAAALAGHYKGEKIYWEIWNEPNVMTFWGKHGKVGNSDSYAEEYTNLVKATVPAMRKVDPNCVILAGSVSNMWSASFKWMDFCFKRGMLKVPWDVWSVHPYGVGAPEDYVRAYATTRKLMNDAGGPSNRPWINSERGFPIGKKEGYAGGEENKAFEYQAWHLVRQYLVDLLEGVNVTIWYEWAGKEGFALYQPGEPTPAFKACQVFIAEMSGYKLEKRIPTNNPLDFVLRFTNPAGGVKVVAWTSPPLRPMRGQEPPVAESPDKIANHVAVIPLGASTGSVEVAQLFGEKITMPVKSGGVEMTLTGAPQYITVKK